jgi:hypothetical protein
MTADDNQPTDEARIRDLIEGRVRAIRAGDVDALRRKPSVTDVRGHSRV